MRKELTILIVDDIAIDRGILKAILEKEYNILETGSGIEALEILEHNPKINMILLDIVMPQMTGLEFLEIVRKNQQYEDIPIIINTQIGEHDTELRALELGADDFILKPYNPKIVKWRINNLADKYILKRESLKNKLAVTNDKLATLIDAVPGGIAIFEVEDDDSILIQFANDSLRQMIQCKKNIDHPCSDNVYDYIINEDRPIIRQMLSEEKNEPDEILHCRVRIYRADYRSVWIGISAKKLASEINKKIYYVVVMDLTKEKIAENQLNISLEELRYRAERDTLTGISNRETFYQKTEKMLLENKGKQYVIGQWNVDRFKVVNELFGSRVGDQVIVDFAEFLIRYLDGVGTYGRLEADHFVFCVPLSYLEDNMTELEQVLGGEKNIISLNYPLLSHVGLYMVEDIHTAVDLMCDRANMALQIIKNNYLKRWNYYNEKLKETILTEQELVNDMETALQQEQFKINIQPIIDTATLQLKSAEALVRWNHPQKGLISPSVFIPLFERNGFISRLDLYVCEEVCKYLSNRKKEGKKIVPISVNLSRINFYNSNLCNQILGLVNKYDLKPSYLKIEITESAYTENPKDLVSAIETFQRYGFRVLMDDFGSGYSSLNMLKDVSVDILKIDMKFMDNLDTSERASNILFSIIQMAKGLHMDVVAEGVETESQFDLLASMGCDSIQGFYFSKPLPLDDFSQKMDESLKEPAGDKLSKIKQTVLIVDDEELNRVSIRECIKQNYNILEATDGKAALRILKKDFSNISLVISDICMPKMSGLELLQEMQESVFLRKIPVLIVTAYGERENEACALELGALDLITKPYDPEILRKRIENLLRISENENMEIEVQSLRESAALKRHVQVMLHNSSAGICQIRVQNSKDLEIQKILFINDRFQNIHNISEENITKLYTLYDLEENIIREDRIKMNRDFERALERKDTSWQGCYRIQWDDGTIKNILSSCLMEYRFDEIIIDYVDLEVVSENTLSFDNSLEIFSSLLAKNTGVMIWKYDIENDSIDLTTVQENGNISRHIIENGREYIVTSSKFRDEDRGRVDQMFEQMLQGADHIQEYYDMINPTGRENPQSKEYERCRITYERLENKKEKLNAAIGILENCTIENETSKKIWREKQYQQILGLGSRYYAETDLTIDEMVSNNSFINVYQPQSYTDYLQDLLQNFIYKKDAEYCMQLMGREHLLYAFEQEKRKIKFEFRSLNSTTKELEWYVAKIYLLRNEKSDHIIASIQIKSVQEEKNKVSQMRKLAEHDDLTSLYNRATFECFVNNTFLNQTDKVCDTAFVMVDVDNFKNVNDSFGHEFGDIVLKAVAKLLLQTFRKDDIVCRLGGDEFAVFIPNASSRERIEQRVKELCTNSHTQFDNKGITVNISCSVGVAFSPEHGQGFHALYTKADEALYYAKNHGKNSVFVYGEYKEG